jgi:hypothetical protein
MCVDVGILMQNKTRLQKNVFFLIWEEITTNINSVLSYQGSRKKTAT